MKPVDIGPSDLETVRRVLREHVPGLEVWAFGSRVSWTARETSDLDIALMTTEPLDAMRLAEMREAFVQSDLPFRVDIVDWSSTSKFFRRVIEQDRAMLVGKDRHNEWNETLFVNCATPVSEKASPSEMGDVPYIGLGHIDEDTLSLRSHGIASDVTSTKTRFKRGDILFGKLRPYFRKVIMAPFDGVCSTDIWVIRPLNGIDVRFLFYKMASQEFVYVATQGSEGTRMPRAKWEFVSRMSCLIPPLPEQRAIAHVLGVLDDKIELNRQMNKTLEEMARALFKSWFVDFDPVRAKMDGCWYPGKSLPGLPAHLYNFFPETLVDSELGEIPEGWKVKALDDIAHYRNGLALQKFRPQENDGRLPVVKIAQLRIDRTGNKEWATENITPECIIDDGDVVFSWSGSLMVKVWCGGKAALNQHLFKVTSIEYPKWFYLHCTKIHLPEFQRIAVDKTTTMGHIKHQHLRDAKCIVPNHDTLVAVDNIFSTLLLQQISIKIQSRFLTTQRDTLLPKLMSGELRISQPACKGGILK